MNTANLVWAQASTTERVSVETGGSQGDGHCYDPSISSDGRYVAFSSYATNLVTGDTNGCLDVFVTTLVTTEAVVTSTVPTLNEWGMIIFMLFAGIISIYCFKRQM